MMALVGVSYGSLGRFMFAPIPQVPGIELLPGGVRVAHTTADTLLFSSPVRDLRAKRIENGEAVFQGLDYVFSPGAVRYSPWRPGVELYFPLGLRFTMRTDLGPFLTWGEGSVGVDVPTAASRWHLLNFRDGQAPLMLVFDEPEQLMITGESGGWVLSTGRPFKGWVRILAPVGPKRVAANVSSLGMLAKEISPLAEELMRPMPTFVNFETRSDSGFITAIWNFDGVGAAIPSALMLCRAGGYDAKIQTGVTRSLLDLVEGPIAFSREPRIVVRFPARRIPVGDALVVGKFENRISSASGFDTPSVVELALSRLMGGRDALTLDAVATSLGEFRRALPTYSDEVTGKSSALPGNGNGADLLAAQALLQLSAGQGSEFLGQLNDRWDPWTWQILGERSDVRSRATGLYAVGAALVGDTAMRARGAMAHAASSAEFVRQDYLKRRGLAPGDERVIQPLKELRQSLFGDMTVAPNRADFVLALSSPVRVVGGLNVSVEQVGDLYLLSWEHRAGDQSSLSLVTEFPVEVEARDNVSSIVPDVFLAETRLKVVPKGPGVCRVALRLPGWARGLPEVVEAPRYSE